MSNVTDPFRAEHEHLLEHVEHVRLAAREVRQAASAGREEQVRRVVGFVTGTLLPHAEAEERVLYPEVARLLGDARATAPMIHDHATIRAYTDQLAAADTADGQQLEELLYGLYALIRAHFEKEEELYLPLLESEPEQAARVLAALEHTHAH